MRRYLVFAGQHFYPQSEAGDFVRAFDTEYEARQVVHVLASGDPYEPSPRDGYAICWASAHYLTDSGDLETLVRLDNDSA